MATANAVVQVDGLPEVKELIESLRSENAILRGAIATQRVIDIPSPASGELRMCMICAEEKPWGVWSPMGAAVCIGCRDKAREPDWKARYEQQVEITYKCKEVITDLHKQLGDKQSMDDLAASGGIVDAP